MVCLIYKYNVKNAPHNIQAMSHHNDEIRYGSTDNLGIALYNNSWVGFAL